MFETVFELTLRKSFVLFALCLSMFFVFLLPVSGTYAQEEDIKARISQIKQEIETIQGDNDRLRTEISDREEKIEELKRKIEQLDEQLKEMQVSSERS